MPETKRCSPCHGSGKIEGGGFQKKDCEDCKGTGRIAVIDNEIDLLAAKQTPSYEESKAKIKAMNDSITDKDAEKILDEELGKTNTKAARNCAKAKKGR